jgi:hypothetical protein
LRRLNYSALPGSTLIQNDIQRLTRLSDESDPRTGCEVRLLRWTGTVREHPIRRNRRFVMRIRETMMDAMERRWTRRNKIAFGVLIVVGLLLGARLTLPYVVKDYVNRQLAALKAYDGRVADIDLHLWRGAYSIDGIEIVKTGAPRPVPFFKARRLNLSVEWRSL